MDIDVICRKRETRELLMVFQEKKTFDATVQKCRTIGGEMAVATDKQALQEMINSVKRLTDECGLDVFSGYTDREEEGVWREANNGAEMNWVHWRDGEPNNVGGIQHCIVFNVETGESNDQACDLQFCPICRVPAKTALNLQGFCKNSSIDRFFVLESNQELLGFMQNKMVWAEETSRWEIVNVFTSQTEAFLNASRDFPLGTHPWHLADGSKCSDPGQEWRSLNLHIKVEQPGQFCCNNGNCYSSDWKCDGDKDCDDESDEVDCDLIIVPATYNKVSSCNNG